MITDGYPALFLGLASLYHFMISKPYQRNSNAGLTLASLWPLILWFIMIKADEDMFAVTVESLVASYYIFTANAAGKNNLVLLTIGLCFSLLSRYAIIFWVPCALVAIWMQQGIKPLIKVCAGIVSAFILIYWLPFLRHDSQIFINGYKYHSVAALGEWNHLDESGRPVHLYSGLGMASWAYAYIPFSEVQQRLEVYQKIHVAICLVVVVSLAAWYWNYRDRIQLKTFLLFSLKLLTFFYAFIQIPYKYLFLTPLLITSVLLADAFALNKNAGNESIAAGT